MSTRDRNKRRLLQRLFLRKVQTRAEIKHYLRVAESTLSYLIRSLLERSLIVSERKISGRGRPREFISLNPEAWRSLGIKVGRESVKAILFDAVMKKISSREIHIYRRMRNLDGYRSMIEELLKNFKGWKPSAVGLSISGIVEKGKVVYSPILNIEGFDVEEIVRRNLPKAEVSVMNDVEALSIYEKHFFGKDKFLVVNFGTGIGACFYDGKVVRSPRGRSIFQMGHIIVGGNEICYCGQRGCLETVASDYAILKRFTGREFSISEFIEFEEERFREDLDRMRKLARTSPDSVRKYYVPSLEVLALHLGNLMVILEPSKIAFYGEGMACWMVEIIEGFIRENFQNKFIQDTSFECRDGEMDAVETGVALDATLRYISNMHF